MNLFKSNSSNTVVIISLIGLSLAVRFCFSTHVEINGDVIFKWALIRDYVENGVIPSQRMLSTHHALRWAINLPVLVIQYLFGTAPQHYYIWPFISSTLGVVFSYLIVKNIHSKLWGIFAAIAVMFSVPMLRQGSQFLPMGPAAAYLLGGIYFFQVWTKEKRFFSLFLCGFFLFLSYGSKITSIYYFPSFFIIILLFSTRSEAKFSFKFFIPLLCFFVLLTSLFCAEAIVTQKLTNVSGGRLACLANGTHGDQERGKIKHSTSIEKKDWRVVSITLKQYIGNFFVYYIIYPEHAPKFGKTLLYIALVLAIATLALKKRSLYPLTIPYLFGFFGHAYAIVSVYPFLRPERMLLRYQTALYILAAIIIVSFLGCLHKKQTSIKRETSLKLVNNFYLFATLFFVLLIVSASGIPKPFSNGYIQTRQNFIAVNKAREQGKSILIRSQTLLPRRKQLMYYRYLALYSNTCAYYIKKGRKYYDYKIYRDQKKQYLLMEKNNSTQFTFDKPHIILQPQ